MAARQIWPKLSLAALRVSHGLARGCVRIVAVAAIVMTYGLGQLGVVGVSGLAMTAASTTSAQAWWRGRRGFFRRGWWGRRGWRRF